MEVIHTKSLHTPEQIRRELASMLSDAGLTLGQFCVLVHCGALEDATEASRILGREITLDELKQELEAIHRVNEIVQTDESLPVARTSDIEPLSPEWLADVVCGAARALPSITWDDALWKMPMVRLLHIRLSGYRSAGGITARPDDKSEALAALLESNKLRNDNNG